MLIAPGLVNCVLDLARHEVVDQRIEQQTVLHALQPRSLPGADQFAFDAYIVQSLIQLDRRRTLADSRIGAEHCQLQSRNLFDLAGEKVKPRTWRRAPN